MSKISPIYIALGANLSNPAETFRAALAALVDADVRVSAISSLWHSPAWPPGLGYPDYVNAVAEIETERSPDMVLALLQNIETDLGRERTVRNAPRTLDLDILDYRGQVSDSLALTLPHPRMMARGFVLFPLLEIAPDWTHPVSGLSANDASARLPLSDVAPMRWLGRL